MKSWRRNGGVGETLESEKWWNIATLESEKWWSRRNGRVGEILESEKWWNIATLESEKWWNIIMTVVALKQQSTGS